VDARPSPELRKPHPPSLSPRALAVAGWSTFLLAGLVFLAIAWSITGRTALAALDSRLADWLHHHSHRALTAFFFAVTNLHSPAAISAASLVFGVLLARLRQWYWLLTLAVAVGGGMLVNTVLKFAYERLRPRFDDPLLTLTSYSFPSGHTAGAVLFYGVLAAFLVSRFYDRRARAACVAGAIAMVTLVAFSRMYLGVHYLSDVLAAACSSTAWLVLCLAGGHALVRGKLRLHWVAGAFFFLLLIAIAVLIPDQWWARFEDAIERMNPVAALLVFCSVYAMALLLLLPAWIFPIAAGAIFGFLWGVFAALIAVAASALAGFLISRYVLPGRMERVARKSDVFKAVDHAVAKDPRKIMVLLRMAPVIPCGLKSYFLGLTRVRLEDYMLATLAGVTPDVLVKVYLGAAGRDVIAHGGALDWALLAGGIVALLALSFIVGRKVRKALKL
jgi:undecaprenyl-diphosphatase